jgi:hypothetical protein
MSGVLMQALDFSGPVPAFHAGDGGSNPLGNAKTRHLYHREVGNNRLPFFVGTGIQGLHRAPRCEQTVSLNVVFLLRLLA